MTGSESSLRTKRRKQFRRDWGWTVRFQVTWDFWGLPFLAGRTGSMRHIGIGPFRVLWWPHDPQQCARHIEGMIASSFGTGGR